MGDDLAVIVPKPRAEDAIEALRSEGVYDERRRVRERDDGVELPVTARPAYPVEAVVEQTDPEPRVRDLHDILRERGFTDDELSHAPRSWAVVGDCVVARFGDCPRPREVGEALCAFTGADTALDRRGVSGPYREPDVRVVAGEGDTETVHAEHGTRYALDLARVMFSPGNQAERVRMGRVVEPDERVFDMFAGIGYFTLPMARAGARVTAAEHNPTAFGYLVENVALNDVADAVTPVLGDCREVLDAGGVEAVDRVVMGYYGIDDGDGSRADEAFDYLPAALDVLAPGGVVHLHAATPDPLVPDRPTSRFEAAVAECGRSVAAFDARRVKSYSEGVCHVVLDARVD